MEEKKTNTKKKTQTKKYYPPKNKKVTKEVTTEEKEIKAKKVIKKEKEIKEVKKEKPDYCKLIILIFILAVVLGVMIFIVYKNIFQKDNETMDEYIITSETTSININEGETTKLVLEMPNDNIDNIIWNITDESIVKIVDNNIEGLKAGTTSIKVTDNNSFEYVFNVNVVSFNGTNKIAVATPTGVGLSKANLSLNVGESVKLNAVVFPENAIQNVTWTSSNAGIAMVDSNGNVKAIQKGTVQIYAETSNGISISCDVTIK